MVKKVFSYSSELACFLKGRRIPRYALAYWPEAPEYGETLLFSNSLRPLCKYLLGIPGQTLVLERQESPPDAPLWRATNVDEAILVQGQTREQAEENFWQEIESLLRGGGYECALYERGRRDQPDLYSLLSEWRMTERIRSVAGSGL